MLDGVDAFLDVHSFGQMRECFLAFSSVISPVERRLERRGKNLTKRVSVPTVLFPYSYSCDVVTRDQENHYEAVLQAAKALRDVHGRVFETGSVCEVSLTSPGESLDWACESCRVSRSQRHFVLVSRDRLTDYFVCVCLLGRRGCQDPVVIRDRVARRRHLWYVGHPSPLLHVQDSSADRKS